MNQIFIFILSFYLHFKRWSNSCSYVGLAKKANTEAGVQPGMFQGRGSFLDRGTSISISCTTKSIPQEKN